MNRQSYLEAGYCEMQALQPGQKVLHNCLQAKVIEGYKVERADGAVINLAADSLILPLNF